MTQYVFKPTNHVWKEVTSLIESVVMERFRCRHGLVSDPFLGHHCCLKPDNPSYLHRVEQGGHLDKPYTLNEHPCVLNRDIICSSPDGEASIQRQQQAAFVNAFDELLPQIVSRWPASDNVTLSRKDAPRLVDFCYHIRNGAAHGNHFSFKVKGRPVKVYPDAGWRDAVIAEALEGKQVMGLRGGFLGVADVIALLHDLEDVVCHP